MNVTVTDRYDDPASLQLKYEWARSTIGARGVGMWTPSATLYDAAATKAMWDAVPSSTGSVVV